MSNSFYGYCGLERSEDTAPYEELCQRVATLTVGDYRLYVSSIMTPASSASPVAIVTGVSSGIGRATAEGLAAAGYRVFGSVRADVTKPPSGVEAIRLDVRNGASIDAAVAQVLERAGRIDVLVNNAGGTLVGALEETSVDDAKLLFDTNFFGAFRMTQAVLPTMRKQGSGRIAFVSSVVGFLPAPFMGFYAASKHALEALAESLDHETRTLGVRAFLVERGFMRTRIDANTIAGGSSLPAYSAMRDRVVSHINSSVAAGEDPKLVAQVVVRALGVKEPAMRYQVGKNAALLYRLRNLLPARAFAKALRKDFQLDA